MITIQDGNYHYTEETGVHDIQLQIQKGKPWAWWAQTELENRPSLKFWLGSCPVFWSVPLQGLDHWQRLLERSPSCWATLPAGWTHFQNSDTQLFNTSVYDELAFGPRQLGLSAVEIEQRVNDTLTLLEIEHLRDRIPYHLSGGEKKLVAIASVLTMNPSLLLFDEPFNGLSPKYQKLIVALLQELKTAGKTIVISSHHFEQIAPIVERVLLFSEEHTITGSYNRADWENHPDIQQSFSTC